MQIDGRRVGVHRLAWCLATGDSLDMPEIVRHVFCATPLCCNPEHLAKGSPLDNRLDSIADGTWSHGEMVPTAKLTRAHVQAIRDLTKLGYGPVLLGQLFDVSQQAVSDILNGKNWAWLLSPA